MAQWPFWAKPEDNQFFDEVSWTGFSLTISLLLELFYHKSLIVSNSLKSCCIVSIYSWSSGVLSHRNFSTLEPARQVLFFSLGRAKPLKLHHGRKLRTSDTQKRRYHSIGNFYVPSILACSFQSSTPSTILHSQFLFWVLCLRWCQGRNQCHGFGITDDSSERIGITVLFPPFMFLRFI